MTIMRQTKTFFFTVESDLFRSQHHSFFEESFSVWNSMFTTIHSYIYIWYVYINIDIPKGIGIEIGIEWDVTETEWYGIETEKNRIRFIY